MMRKDKMLVFLMLVFCSFFYLKDVMAAEPMVIQMTEEITAMVPQFMNGNPQMIEGFVFKSDLVYNGVKIGTFDGSSMMVSPPMDFTVPMNSFNLTGVMSFPGLGTCQVNGTGISMGTSNTLTTGEFMVESLNRIEECTDGLTGLYGMVSGFAQLNMNDLSQNQSMEMTFRLLAGF